jgi:hypothetical protein
MSIISRSCTVSKTENVSGLGERAYVDVGAEQHPFLKAVKPERLATKGQNLKRLELQYNSRGCDIIYPINAVDVVFYIGSHVCSQCFSHNTSPQTSSLDACFTRSSNLISSRCGALPTLVGIVIV